MTFWQKIKQAFRSFMFGRNGADHLSVAFLWAGLILYLLGGIVGSIAVSVIFPILGILLNVTGFACYVLCIFRMFSRNVYKRRAVNQRFCRLFRPVKNFFVLRKNKRRDKKTHVYKKCPQCKKVLRLPRVSGKHTVKCPCCQNRFEMKIK
jgi:hypothetical protein